MILILLSACAGPGAAKGNADPSVFQDDIPPCEPEAPVAYDLSWTDAGPGGVSAQDLFGSAAGDSYATLTWDDGAVGAAVLSVDGMEAEQVLSGDPATCPVAVSGSVMWTLTTADRRLVTDGDARWTAADAASPPAFLTIDAALDPAEVGFEPLRSGSTLYLALALSAEGELVAVRIEEVWPRAADRNRVCVRAAMDAASLGCHDTGEGAGRD